MLGLQAVKQVQDFRLHRHIQRRSGLIQQQKLRAQQQRAGNGNALTLAAGKLVRVAPARVGGKPHLVQRIGHLLRDLRLAANVQRLRQRARNRVVGMQRRPRVLKHHLHVAAKLAFKASPWR